MKRLGLFGALALVSFFFGACGSKGGGLAKEWGDKPLKSVDDKVKDLAFTISLPDGLEREAGDRPEWRHGAIDADGPRFHVFLSPLPLRKLDDTLKEEQIQLKDATAKEVDGAQVITSAPKRIEVRVHRAAGDKDFSCWGSYVTDSTLDDRDAMLAWLEKVCLTARPK
jgi:hypothetical protein